jgi:hypothetical protein
VEARQRGRPGPLRAVAPLVKESKMLGESSRVISSHERKKKVRINICSEMCVFFSNCRITFYHNYLKYVTYYLHLTQYIYNTSFQFIKFSVLVVHQVTIHNKFSTCPPPKSMHTEARYHWLSHHSKRAGPVRMV